MKKRQLIQGDMKTKQDMSNMKAGGYLVTADFELPDGEKQMNTEQCEEICAAIQITTRFQMLTEKEAEQIIEICINAALRCGFLKEAQEEKQ